MSVEFHLYAVDEVPVPSTKPTKNTVSQCFAESLINTKKTVPPCVYDRNDPLNFAKYDIRC